MCYKENKSLFLRRHEKFFLVEKWGTLERAWRYACRNLLNLDCQDSIHFDIFQVG